MFSMKKVLKKQLIIFSFLVFSLNFPAFSFAEQAQVLSDEELDCVYAGGLQVDWDVIDAAQQSAVAIQSNLGAMASFGAGITNGSISNSNYATIFNAGNSSLAAQNNIALAVARGGDINSLTIDNMNHAVVKNYAVGGNYDSLDINQLSLQSSDLDLSLNNAQILNSALAMQNNVAAAIAFGGDIHDLMINNTNFADVLNFGNSGLAVQNNIAMAISVGGNIDGVTINNLNQALVVNNYNGLGGGIQSELYSLKTANFDISINSLSSSISAEVIQNNFAVTALINSPGVKSNINITNTNLATIINNL